MTAPLSLITGACGFMGTHMVEVLQEAGHRIRTTDLAACYNQDDFQAGRFPSVLKRLGVEFVPADVTRAADLDRLFEGVENVFHIAAVFSYSAPWDFLYRVNVEGTRNLLACLARVPTFKKIVLWGAAGIYRFPDRPEDLPIREDSPKAPSNNYLKSKWEQENLLAQFCRGHGMRYSIVRGTTVYGPRAVYGGGQMIRDPMKMKKLALPKNFTFRIPTGHVRDICRAALFTTQNPATDGEDYNVNDDSRTTTVDFFRMMAAFTGKPFQLLPPVPPGLVRFILSCAATAGKYRRKLFGGRPPQFERDVVKYFGKDLVIANDKLKKTGFQFEYPEFEKGLRETIKWYQENWLKLI